MVDRRFAATVSYDGTDFGGSQRQRNARSVQAELECAAAATFGQPPRVALAGRTDAGVHAIGQVAALSAETDLEPETIGRALNARLPEDVAVRAVRLVPAEFDPRRWARRRCYRYTVLNSADPYPLLRRTTWHFEARLELGAMDEAGRGITGRRDFAACSGAIEEGRSRVRTVSSSRWTHQGCLAVFDIEADAFLPHMVRLLVGAMVRVGRGSLTLEQFQHLLEAASPGTLGPAAPPQGLCLQRVCYDEGYLP